MPKRPFYHGQQKRTIHILSSTGHQPAHTDYFDFPKKAPESFYKACHTKWASFSPRERGLLRSLLHTFFFTSFSKKFGPFSRNKKKFKICVFGIHGISGISKDIARVLSDYFGSRGLSDFFEIKIVDFASPKLGQEISSSHLIIPLLSSSKIKDFAQGNFKISVRDLEHLGKKYRAKDLRTLFSNPQLNKNLFVQTKSKSQVFFQNLRRFTENSKAFWNTHDKTWASTMVFSVLKSIIDRWQEIS